MALLKSVTIPNSGPTGISVSYFRIDKVEINEPVCEATLYIQAYQDESNAKNGGMAYYQGGRIDVRGSAFGHYFSRKALNTVAVSGVSIHTQGYRILQDYIDFCTGMTGLSVDQQALFNLGNVWVRNDFGGANFFVDAQNVFDPGQTPPPF